MLITIKEIVCLFQLLNISIWTYELIFRVPVKSLLTENCSRRDVKMIMTIYEWVALEKSNVIKWSLECFASLKVFPLLEQ